MTPLPSPARGSWSWSPKKKRNQGSLLRGSRAGRLAGGDADDGRRCLLRRQPEAADRYTGRVRRRCLDQRDGGRTPAGLADPLGFECADHEIGRQQNGGDLGEKQPEAFHGQIVGCAARKACRHHLQRAGADIARVRPVGTSVTTTKTIFIEPLAPTQAVDLARPCNGCGVCCLAQPCPLGHVAVGADARRLALPCAGTQTRRVYRCGAVAQPGDMLRRAACRSLLRPALRPCLAPVLAVVARRAIATDVGCDSCSGGGRCAAGEQPAVGPLCRNQVVRPRAGAGLDRELVDNAFLRPLTRLIQSSDGALLVSCSMTWRCP